MNYVLARWLSSVSSLGHTWEESSYRGTRINECYTIKLSLCPCLVVIFVQSQPISQSIRHLEMF